MRALLILLILFSVGAQALPLVVKPEPKARGYTIEVDSQWVPSQSPNVWMKREEGDPKDTHPQSLSLFATHDRDAGVMVANAKRFGLPGLEPIKLGELDALLKREPRGFIIHAGVGTTKITISYWDGRADLNQPSRDTLLQMITSSFRWTK